MSRRRPPPDRPLTCLALGSAASTSATTTRPTSPLAAGDTGPMSLEDMYAWFEMRGAGQPGFSTVTELIDQYYGKTEDDLDEMYAAMHGPVV